MPKRWRILAIDDEMDALRLLRMGLSADGFDVVVVSNPREGLRTAYRMHPDAVILDVMMPGMNGYEVCRRLREMSDVPVLFLTAKSDIEDIVKGFSVGGDDYIVKPYEIPELLCRLRALLRRAERSTGLDNAILFPADDVTLDCNRHELTLPHGTVTLTPKEFEILRYLISHYGKILSHDAILARVWGSERIGDHELVKQYIYRLRKKIEEDPNNPRYLHTAWGEGYYFDSGK